MAALNVLCALSLDRVLLVVANVPWQKVDERSVTPAHERLAMVEAAVEGVPGLEASRLEIDRGGPSYTADTLEALAEGDPTGCRFLILGADAAGGLTTWERWESIPSLATLVLVDRPGLEYPQPPAGWRFERVQIPRLDVSSTDLRRRSEAGEPLEFLTAPGVVAFLHRHPLYRGTP